ncbi:MAG: NAD-dependent epimerase/dehydratase family protein [Candidatus Micrarchaeota archaeon]
MHVVTGGTGRIGSHLVKALLSKGEKVKVLVRKKDAVLPEGATPHIGDITDKATLEGLVEAKDTVFHMAAVIDERLNDRMFYDVNVLGTTNIISACRGKGVSHLVHVSSVSVFGNPEILPATEQCPKKPLSKYGKSKMLSEEIIVRQWRNINSTIVRPGMIYGLGFDEGYFPVLKGLQKGMMPIIGSGENHVPLIHISDLVKALILVSEHEDAIRDDFNITGPGHPTQRELFRTACKHLGVKEPDISVPIWLAKIALPIVSIFSKSHLSQEHLERLTRDRSFDSTKIKKNLGFEPATSLSQGIKEMVEYYKERRLIA